MTSGPLEPVPNEDPSGPDSDPALEPLERIEADVEQIARTTTDLPVEFRRLIELLRRESFSGPLPPPEILEGYKQAYPEAPQIVFGELVKQGEHRRVLEGEAVQQQETRANRGQIFAFLIVLAVLVVGCVAILENQGWVAVALFGSALVGVVGLFIYGSRRQHIDLSDKRTRLAEALSKGDSEPMGDSEESVN